MKEFKRSKENKKIWGLFGGIAEYTNTDPILWRLLGVLLFLGFPISFILFYIIGTIITEN